VVDTKNEENEPHFALMTMNDSVIKVLPCQPPSQITVPNTTPTPSCDDDGKQRFMIDGAEPSSSWLNENPIISHTNAHNKSNLLTLIDSGASDHCFTNKTLFKKYTPLSQTISGLSAGKGSTFDIIGKGTIEFCTTVNGISKKISIDDILYTPSLRSNLISVSKLSAKGASVVFDGDRASVRLKNGTEAMTAVRSGQLYVVNIDTPTISAFAIRNGIKTKTSHL